MKGGTYYFTKVSHSKVMKVVTLTEDQQFKEQPWNEDTEPDTAWETLPR